MGGPTGEAEWSAVDSYLEGELLGQDAALSAVARASEEAKLPPIAVSPLQGAFLHLLVRATRARRVLEVGTLGGYSTTWLARALPPSGAVVTLEIDPHHAEVARANFERAGIADRVEVRIGPAIESLEALRSEGAAPFDFVFLDADKPNNEHYLRAARALCRPGSLIVVDNVVRNGAVADPASKDASVIGSRRAVEALAETPGLIASALQTVGSKGYDGFAIALVEDPSAVA